MPRSLEDTRHGHVGLLADMIMLGLGRSSFTKDFEVRYLVYVFGVGMKLMALVMIAKIGSNVLLSLAQAPTATSDQFITTLAIAGISVVVFIIAMYVPSIMQGVVQGASVSGAMESVTRGGRAASFAASGAFLGAGAVGTGFAAAQAARAGGSSAAGCVLKGMGASFSSGAMAAGSAAKEKAIGSPVGYAGSLLGLANAKLQESRSGHASPPPAPERNDK